MQSPDISRANLARVLREAAALIDAKCHKDIRKSFHERNFAENECRALARALVATPVVSHTVRCGGCDKWTGPDDGSVCPACRNPTLLHLIEAEGDDEPGSMHLPDCARPTAPRTTR